ncbi:MAG: DUF262 domain-containing protein [Phocaeicola sp.]
MSANNLKLLAIPQLMGKHFFIPDYQRGYKWEKDQVYALLKDLWRYFKSGKKNDFYCLQPIVVKECSVDTILKYELPDISALAAYEDNDLEKDGPKNNVWYEVIDGQQRLTTIRILIAFHIVRNFASDTPYELRYATRDGLHEIFENLVINIQKKEVKVDDAFKYKEYIDVEYVLDCANNIINWFNDDKEVEKNKYNELGTFLTNSYMDQDKDIKVQVIWYETSEKTDARDIFERLNDLQVPLSSSELIRAIFLSKSAIYEERELDSTISPDEMKILLKDKEAKQSSINAKWDEIEHYFRNDDVWAFMTNKHANDYRNRIELLFDLMSMKDFNGKDDRLYTYIWFDNKIEKDGWSLWDLWQNIVKNYDTIRFWNEDRDFYHKIGFLIHEKDGSKTLPKMLEYVNSGQHKKSEFKNYLLKEIRSVIQGTNDKKLSDLLYDNKADYKKLKNVLLLYNIELMNQSPTIEARFPFKDYKVQEGIDLNGKQRKGWTLEHIHAQDSECLNPTNRTEWIDWVRFTLEARKNAPHPSDSDLVFVAKLESLLVRNVETGKCKVEDERNFRYADHLVPLFQEDLNLWSGGKPYVLEHQLTNLALLSGEINSSIGKGSFFTKQQRINKSIAVGEYVPIATQKVFMKHYYSEEIAKEELLSRQLLTWDEDDRTNYMRSIKSVLEEYCFNF